MTHMLSTLQSGYQVLKREGIRQMFREGAFFAWESAFRAYHSATGRSDDGGNIYDQDWDVLVVLDACRVDLMDEVAQSGAYDLLPESSVDTFRQPGSYSKEWMNNTFTDRYADEMEQTIHVTGNPFSSQALKSEQFYTLDEVWEYAWDDDAGVVMPRPMTDRAINHWRNRDPDEVDRMIVHYMQPHIPFLNHEMSQPLESDNWGKDSGRSEWELVRDGELDPNDAWAAYRENLEIALDDVSILLNNIDADTVVLSADHGNSIGEHGLWGHPAGIDVDELREVPWVTTSATNEETHEPDTWVDEQSNGRKKADEDVQERLKNLGYK